MSKNIEAGNAPKYSVYAERKFAEWELKQFPAVDAEGKVHHHSGTGALNDNLVLKGEHRDIIAMSSHGIDNSRRVILRNVTTHVVRQDSGEVVTVLATIPHRK